MPLTVRTNGSGGSNLISASWFNDYHDLLTGVMTDQLVTLKYSPASTTTTPGVLVTGNGNAPYFAVMDQYGTYAFQVAANGHPTFGATVQMNGNLGISGLLSSDGGSFVTDGTGHLLCAGKIGVAAQGDVLDASGYDTFLKARGASNLVHLQQNGADIATFALNGISIPSNSAYIAVGSYLGIKTISGTKLAEFKHDGTFVIAGTTYYTTQSSYSTGVSASFDGFDLGECYLCDANYPAGTIVCPGANNVLSKCLTDGCHASMVITTAPAYCIGVPNPTSFVLPVALAGRVLANCSVSIPAGSLVCSDGNGGVRPLASGETNHVIGFTLQADSGGQVGVFIRPMYAKA